MSSAPAEKKVIKCTECGCDIPEGVLSCPACGAEVVLVPEYLSEDMQREQLRRERAEEKRLLREQEERRERRRREHMMKPHVRVILTVCALILSVALFHFAVYLIDLHSEKTFAGQTFITKESDLSEYEADNDESTGQNEDASDKGTTDSSGDSGSEVTP